MSICRRMLVAVALASLVAVTTAPTAAARLRPNKLVSPCPSGSSYLEKVNGPFRLEGCLREEADRFITAPGTTAAELSGFDVKLLGSARLALSKKGAARVTSVGGNLELRLKAGPIDFPIHSGTLDISSPVGELSQSFDLDEVDIPAAARFLGLKLDGDVDGDIRLSMTSTRTGIAANLKFPALLGGSALAVDLAVVDGEGLKLSELRIVPGAQTLPFDGVPGAFVKELRFAFQNPDKLTIGGKVVLPMFGTAAAIGGELKFNTAGLQSIAGSVSGLNVPMGDPSATIFFQGGSLNVGVNPLTFGGSLIFSGGPVEETTGAFIVKYTGGFQFVNSSPSKVTLSGTTELLGLGDLKALNATQSVTYSSDSVLSLDQVIDVDLTVPSVGGLKGRANLDGSFSRNGFQVSGSANGSFSFLGVTLASGTGTLRANGVGYGMCLTGSVGLGISATGQARADWGKTPALSFGCNLARFQARSLLRARARAAAGGTVVVPAGATNAAVRVRGASAAPSFNLRLPDGTVLEVRDPKSTATTVGGKAVYLVDATNTTTVYVDNPPVGTWTVEEIAGQPIAELTSATDAPPATTATVTGTGERRTLKWTVGSLDGGRLQLSEVQADGTTNALVDTTALTGTSEFLVPFGPAGKRRIVATITGADGIPRAAVDAGEYVASAPFVPQPPRDIKASFSKGTLTFSQVPPKNPDRRPDYWNYKISLADGRVLFLQGAGAKKVRVKRVRKRSRFVVRVNGIEREGLQGKARVERGRT